MTWYQILIGVFLIVISLGIIVIVLMQQSRQNGLSGAIAGGADTFFGKNKGRSFDAKLSRITKILSVIFFAVLLISTFLLAFLVSQ